MTGKVGRAAGQGLKRQGTAKSEAGLRTLPLPRFAVDVLKMRRQLPFLGQQTMIFAATAGTFRDPNNFNKQWRHVRGTISACRTSPHSFRKSLATLIDDEGLSARSGADHPGHTNVSMTQDKYMSRGRVHTQVADLLDHVVSDSKDDVTNSLRQHPCVTSMHFVGCRHTICILKEQR